MAFLLLDKLVDVVESKRNYIWIVPARWIAVGEVVLLLWR
jgi:hypothetical protein